MKYIVMRVDCVDGVALEIPFAFPDLIIHSGMAAGVVIVLKAHYPGASIKPVSAGFFNSMECSAGCYGKSESLGLGNRGVVDENLIKMADYGSNIL